jgi:hypothetical protein
MESALILKVSDNLRKSLIDSVKSQLESAKLHVIELTDLLSQLGESANSEPIPLNSASLKLSKPILNERNLLDVPPITSEFKDNWSWGQKIKFILSNVGHCLTTREIADSLVKYENFAEDPVRAISTIISLKVNKGLFFKRYKVFEDEHTNINQFTYYIGLKEWFDEAGNLIDEKYRGKQ